MGSQPAAPDVAVSIGRLRFPNPFILPSAQASRTGDMLLHALRAGWGGVVTQTITEDEHLARNVAPRLASHRIAGQFVGLVNIELTSERPLAVWRVDIATLKGAFPDRPVVASIAGSSREGWTRLARECASAGADALELNVSIPHGLPERGQGAAIGRDPGRVAEVTGWVTSVARVPVWVKLTPEAPSLVEVALAAKSAGAAAVTATNNFRCVPELDIETGVSILAVRGATTFAGYAGPAVKPLVLRCVAEIARALPDLPVIACGATTTWDEAVEAVMWGASAVQVYTPVLTDGRGIVGMWKRELAAYMLRHDMRAVAEMRGAALAALHPHSELERGIGALPVNDELRCVRCGQCATACNDAGYQAITGSEGSLPLIDANLCTACGLCSAICPAESIHIRAAVGPSLGGA